MRFWTDGGFFRSVKGHVIKWWQFTIMPILRINNNSSKQQMIQKTVQPETMQMDNNNAHATTQTEVSQNGESIASVTQQQNIAESKQKSADNKNTVQSEDPMEVLNRINAEKEERRRKEIEVARKKAEEQERINAIMNANKVDVNAFIEAGKAAKEEKALARQAKEKELEEKRIQEENLQRAQEIMDRLNREAAEDEAKKQSEIEAAKQEAKKKFG